MEERLPSYYDNERIFRAELFNFSVISFAFVSLFIYNHLVGFYQPFLTIYELLISIGLCLIAYLLSAFAAASLNRTEKLFSYFTSVSALGSLIFGIGLTMFLYVDTLVDIRNYRELSFSISGDPPRPELPTLAEMLLFGVGITFTAFVCTGVLHKVFNQAPASRR